MKKLLAILFCVLALHSVAVVPAAAAEYPGKDGTIINQTVEYFADGSYYIETVHKSAIQPLSDSTSGTKTATYYTASGKAVFSVLVTGTFTYDGSSAKATDALGALTTHVSSATSNEVDDYVSGASAYATGSVNYEGLTLRKTVRLTCDKDGNLS